MMKCTITEAVAAKRRIEDAIQLAINEFRKETGLDIDGIELVFDHSIGNEDNRHVIMVALDVRLPRI